MARQSRVTKQNDPVLSKPSTTISSDDKENQLNPPHTTPSLTNLNVTKRRSEWTDDEEPTKKTKPNPSTSSPISSSSLSSLLAEKDAAYALLLHKYQQLKESNQSSSQSLFTAAESSLQQHLHTAQQLATHWQQQHTALTHQHNQHQQTIDTQLTALNRTIDLLSSQLKSSEAEVEGYMWLLGGRVRVMDDGRVGVKLVNGVESRVMEFVLDGGKEEGQVEYKPKVIDMGGLAYPTELRESMWFKTERTPNFTRYLLGLLYKKGEDGEGEEEGREEEKESAVEGEGGKGEEVESSTLDRVEVTSE